MSGYDFSSSLSGYGSSTPSYSGGSGGAAQKQQVMDQVRNQVAVAQAQELLQVKGLAILKLSVGPFFVALS